MPLDLTFRKMLIKYIPQVTEKDLRKYEGLIALRHQLIHETESPESNIPTNKQKNTSKKNLGRKQKPPTVVDDITRISEQAQAIFAKVKWTYKMAYMLNIATRQFALQQGKFLQIPSTGMGLLRYLITMIKYRCIQFVALPVLWTNKIIHSIKPNFFPKFIYTAATAVLIVFGYLYGFQKIPIKPNVSNIPGQVITVGEEFSHINLDEYVSDKDNPDSTILWSCKFSENLKVTIDNNRVASIKQLHSGWTGSSVFIFTAMDSTGLADSDTVLFTVQAAKDTNQNL